MIDRQPKGGGLFDNQKCYPVYIISNIEQATVLKSVSRETLLRKDGGDRDHCGYLSLATIGKYGKNKSDFLPYNYQKNTETVTVIDRSKLDETEKGCLTALYMQIYKLATPPNTNKPTIYLMVQCNAAKDCYQVLIDLPDGKWLDEITTNLYAMSLDDLWNEKKRVYEKYYPVTSTAIVTNESEVVDKIATEQHYSEIR